MRVDSWCFCNGGGKYERLKASIYTTKSAAMAKLSRGGEEVSGTGFLIHRNLFLTTHVNLPSVNAAESTEIRLQNGVPAILAPHRFFITSSILDLTVVGLDIIEGDSISLPHYLKLCSKPNLQLGNSVYLLGHAQNFKNEPSLSVGEAKVVIATDNLIKFSTEEFTWIPGSAGFDSVGNLAFMICDPMKIATPSKSPSSSSNLTNWKKDNQLPMQFGIPLPVIFDWLNQHWEGGTTLDDLMRLVSVGHRSERSCASFSMRRVFKETLEETVGPTSSSPITVSSKPEEQLARTSEDQRLVSLPNHNGQGIPAPEIYESPKVSSNPIKFKKKETVRLLDINFPPRMSKIPAIPRSQSSPKEEKTRNIAILSPRNEEYASICSVSVTKEDDSSVSEEETLYSAETAESRNYTSPREGRFQPVGRSQSCVNYYNRNITAARKSQITFEKQRSFMNPKNSYSHKTIDYFSPTVSSIMKKRNDLEQRRSRLRPTAVVRSSGRWNF